MFIRKVLKSISILKVEKIAVDSIDGIKTLNRNCIFSHPLNCKVFLVICKWRCKIAYKMMGIFIFSLKINICRNVRKRYKIRTCILTEWNSIATK